MQFFYAEEISGSVYTLSAEESRHCVKVLRKKKGDEICITDGKGNLYVTRLEETSLDACRLAVVSVSYGQYMPPYRLQIAVAPTKNTDRIEWFVEKSTEIGISRISFVECEHSERIRLKRERIEKIAVSAMKQSLKTLCPQVDEVVGLKAFLSGDFSDKCCFIGYCGENFPKKHLKTLLPACTDKEIVVLIGPEGDFSPAEVEMAVAKGFVPVTLGSSRLRTETAALFSVAAVALAWE